jgi:hypothetical protein
LMERLAWRVILALMDEWPTQERREGHSALRVKDGKLEKFDPNPPPDEKPFQGEHWKKSLIHSSLLAEDVLTLEKRVDDLRLELERMRGCGSEMALDKKEQPNPFDAELQRAKEKFPAFNSAHEGLAVIEEELHELRLEVYAGKRRDVAKMKVEAIQVAAMAMRFVDDCCKPELTRRELEQLDGEDRK